MRGHQSSTISSEMPRSLFRSCAQKNSSSRARRHSSPAIATLGTTISRLPRTTTAAAGGIISTPTTSSSDSVVTTAAPAASVTTLATICIPLRLISLRLEFQVVTVFTLGNEVLQKLGNFLVGFQHGKNKLLGEALITLGVEGGGQASVTDTTRPT